MTQESRFLSFSLSPFLSLSLSLSSTQCPHTCSLYVMIHTPSMTHTSDNNLTLSLRHTILYVHSVCLSVCLSLSLSLCFSIYLRSKTLCFFGSPFSFWSNLIGTSRNSVGVSLKSPRPFNCEANGLTSVPNATKARCVKMWLAKSSLL